MKLFYIMSILFWVGFLNSLSLYEAVDLALKNNLELERWFEEINIADNIFKDARSNILPQINFSGGYNYSETRIPRSFRTEPFNITGNLSDTASDDEQFIAEVTETFINNMIPDKKSSEYTLAGQVRMDQVLYLGGKLMSGIRAADRYRLLERKRFELRKQSLIMETIELYYNLVLMQQVYEINLDGLNLAQLHLQRVENFYEQGMVSEYELIRAELEVARLKPEVLEAENNYEILKQSFKNHIGFSGEEIYAEQDIVLPQVDLIVDEKLINQMLENRLEVQIAQLSNEMYEIQLRAERGNYLPDIVFSAEFNKFSNSSNSSLRSENFGNSYQVGIGVRLPLFTGFSNSAKISKARSEFRQSELNLRNLKDNLELDLKNSVFEVQKEKERLSSEQKRLRLAQRGLEIAESRYENQTGIQLEVFDSQLAKRSALLSELNSSLNYLISYYRLEMALGNDLSEIVKRNSNK